jgi:outer membrane protein TolC
MSNKATFAGVLTLGFALSSPFIPTRARAQSGSAPAPATSSASSPRRLSFGEAVELAVKRGPEIRAADQAVQASEFARKSTSARRFPGVRAEGNVLRWNEGLIAIFGPPGSGSPPVTVREQVTWQFTAAISQPISGLIALSRLLDVDEHGVLAAKSDRADSTLDTATRAADAYLRVLEMSALKGVAEQTLKQVEGQLKNAEVLEKGGVLGPVDVLRLRSARDTTRQRLIAADSALATANSALVLALDLPAGTAIETVDDLPEPPPAISIEDADVAQSAVENRPDLEAARERQKQAESGEEVALAALLPNINAVALYQHTEGQGPFLPVNAWYLGGTLTWDVWDWGRTWNSAKEAAARARQSAIRVERLADQAVFDAQRRLREGRTAFEVLASSRSGLAAAEEAYRIQDIRYKEGAATTTDLLESETDLASARAAYARARYDYYLAQAQLARAIGQLPSVNLQVKTGP